MAKVLLADDEAEIRETLAKVFQAKGDETLEFSDGRAALDAALLQKPDLVILDVMMPKLNGWEACKSLKADPRTSSIPVIILTAKVKETDELMSAEAGADLYLTKPFNPLEVYQKAAELLGGEK